MEEYLRLNGDQLKLGIKDDFRYVRYQELAAMAETPEGKQSPIVERALKDPSTLYRFPFPWEDRQSWDDIRQRNMFDPVIILNAAGIKIEHHSVVRCITAPGGNYQVNVYLPCPYLLAPRGEPEDPTKPALCSALPAPFIVVAGERVRRGQAYTIFSCIYCEKLLSCTNAELALLQKQNQNQHQHRVDAKVLARLIAAE